MNKKNFIIFLIFLVSLISLSCSRPNIYSDDIVGFKVRGPDGWHMYTTEKNTVQFMKYQRSRWFGNSVISLTYELSDPEIISGVDYLEYVYLPQISQELMKPGRNLALKIIEKPKMVKGKNYEWATAKYYTGPNIVQHLYVTLSDTYVFVIAFTCQKGSYDREVKLFLKTVDSFKIY